MKFKVFYLNFLKSPFEKINNKDNIIQQKKNDNFMSEQIHSTKPLKNKKKPGDKNIFTPATQRSNTHHNPIYDPKSIKKGHTKTVEKVIEADIKVKNC